MGKDRVLPGQLALFDGLDQAGEAESRGFGRFAELRKAYLRERRSQLYKELRQAGQLEAHCRERGQDAARQFDALLAMGWNILEAEEWARRDLLDQ